MRKQDFPVVVFSLAYMVVFVAISLTRHNYEFIMYSVVVVGIAAWILVKQPTVQFDPLILWGLSLWGLLHMAGGNLSIGNGVLYNLQLLPRVLRYDQFVHAFGLGTATLVCFHVLKNWLCSDTPRRFSLILLVALMGCGVGAINEIVEFVAVLVMPETNVGGYENTLWDLVFNLIGSTAAATWAVRHWRPQKTRSK